MIESINPVILSVAAGLASGVFMSGVTIGVFKKTLNGTVKAVHRIDERQERMNKKLDDHITEETLNQNQYLSRLGRIEGTLSEHTRLDTRQGRHHMESL